MAKRTQTAGRPARPSRVSYSFEAHVPTYDILGELDVKDERDLGELVQFESGGGSRLSGLVPATAADPGHDVGHTKPIAVTP